MQLVLLLLLGRSLLRVVAESSDLCAEDVMKVAVFPLSSVDSGAGPASVGAGVEAEVVESILADGCEVNFATEEEACFKAPSGKRKFKGVKSSGNKGKALWATGLRGKIHSEDDELMTLTRIYQMLKVGVAIGVPICSPKSGYSSGRPKM